MFVNPLHGTSPQSAVESNDYAAQYDSPAPPSPRPVVSLDTDLYFGTSDAPAPPAVLRVDQGVTYAVPFDSGAATATDYAEIRGIEVSESYNVFRSTEPTGKPLETPITIADGTYRRFQTSDASA